MPSTQARLAQRSCPSILAALTACAFLLVSAPSGAAPVTLLFQGRVSTFTQLATGQVRDDLQGALFLGWATYDIANAQRVRSESEPNYRLWQGSTISGCEDLTNGICTEDYGSAPPVVIDYGLLTPVGWFRPLSGNLLNQSSVSFYTDYLCCGSGQDILDVHLGQSQNVYYLDGSRWVTETTRRVFNLSPLAWEAEALFGSTLDPEALPDFSQISTTDDRFFFQDLFSRDPWTPNGNSQISPRSFEFNGRLTRVVAVNGALSVPEPSGVVLLVVCLVGLAFTRRRQLEQKATHSLS